MSRVVLDPLIRSSAYRRDNLAVASGFVWPDLRPIILLAAESDVSPGLCFDVCLC